MDIKKLLGHVPVAVFNELDSVMSKFSINSPLRLSHFLSQCSHESGGFMVVKENLNYSAEGLTKTFRKYFPTIESTNGYAKSPEKIANKVYGNRMGNGNEISGDGYRYSGRGFIQLTGKENYHLFDDFVVDNILDAPALVASKYPLLSAAWFFSKNGLNSVSDTGSSVDVITKVSKRINGGTIGLEDRIVKFNQFYSILK